MGCRFWPPRCAPPTAPRDAARSSARSWRPRGPHWRNDMSEHEVGDRVMAIISAERETMTVKSLGEGVYMGEEMLPDTAVGFLAKAVRAARAPNPRIDLDSGKTVWGCECWWGTVKSFRDRLPSPPWTWVDVDIDDERRNY